eukprot:g174.t1
MTEQITEESGHLLSNKGFGFASWIKTRWFGVNRGYQSVTNNSSEVEDETPGEQLNTINSCPVDLNVPPAPPNTPPESVREEAQEVTITLNSDDVDEETTECEGLLNPTSPHAESSAMASNRSQILSSLPLFENRRKVRPHETEIARQFSNERTCLICLEPLTEEEFANDSAILLDCQCKGEAAFRHKECAQKWINIKGNRTCDVCRAPITNLVAPPSPRSEADFNRLRDNQNEEGFSSQYEPRLELFDCIKLTWILTIVTMIVFEFDLTEAFTTGLIVALIYAGVRRMIRGRDREITDQAEETDQELNEVDSNQQFRIRSISIPAIVVQ